MTLSRQLTQEKISSARVLVVGDAMLDRYWYGAVERISPEAPVAVVRVTRTEERMGGAANVAYNIVTLGAKASLLSVVGEDEASHSLEALVAKTGITPYFGRDVRLKTTVKLRVIGRQQQLIRLDFGYKNATVITPNRTELEQVIGSWTDEAELQIKVHKLRASLNLQALLLTRSEAGMTLFDDQGELHVPALAREVFDVTGAGDTVIATLAAMAATGMSLREAVPIANRAGGIVVGKFGTATVNYNQLFGNS